MESKSKPLVYVPAAAKINLENCKMDAPETQYEKRKVAFPRDKVKEQITKKDTP